MSLEEAINYYGMLARQADMEAAYFSNASEYSATLRETADRYDQLYRWLCELREYKQGSK